MQCPYPDCTGEVTADEQFCGECGRWFPIDGGIPELLPDHLRNAQWESAIYQTVMTPAPPELRRALDAFSPSGDASSDPGGAPQRSSAQSFGL